MPHFASLLPLDTELDLGAVDERYRRADHVDMQSEHDTSSILDAAPVVDVVIPDARESLRVGAFSDLEGLMIESTYSGEHWIEILESWGVEFTQEAFDNLEALGNLVAVHRLLGRSIA